MLGLEYSGDEVAASLRAGLPAGLADLVLNFPPGFVAGLLLGWDPLEALLLGGVTYISSSSIVAKVLDDLDRLGNRETPAIVLSVSVIEDLAMAPYLPLVAVLLAGGTFIAGVLSVGAAVAAVAGALVVALRHGRAVSRGISHPSDEVVLLTVFGLLLVVGGVAESLQLSAGVVAFLVGLMISGSVADRARQLLRAPARPVRRPVLRAVRPAGRHRRHPRGARGGRRPVARHRRDEDGDGLAGGARVRRRARPPAGRHGARRARRFSIVIAGLAWSPAVTASLGRSPPRTSSSTAVSGPLLMRYADRLAPLFARHRQR